MLYSLLTEVKTQVIRRRACAVENRRLSVYSVNAFNRDRML